MKYSYFCRNTLRMIEIFNNFLNDSYIRKIVRVFVTLVVVTFIVLAFMFIFGIFSGKHQKLWGVEFNITKTVPTVYYRDSEEKKYNYSNSANPTSVMSI